MLPKDKIEALFMAIASIVGDTPFILMIEDSPSDGNNTLISTSADTKATMEMMIEAAETMRHEQNHEFSRQ